MIRIILYAGDKVEINKINTPDEDEDGNLIEEISFQYVITRADGAKQLCELNSDIEFVSF